MALTFRDVTICDVTEEGNITPKDLGSSIQSGTPLLIQLLDEQENLLLRFRENESSPPITNLSIELYKESETARFGTKSYVIRDDSTHPASYSTLLLQFSRESDVIKFADTIRKFKTGNKESVFAQRTEESSAVQYFQFYGYLSQQQNMMQDYVRTSTYQKAILANMSDFKDKVILDVGAGSGILSFFAVQAGARKVYAVEASSMAKHAETLVFSNKVSPKIAVIPGKIEEISIPEQVDVIISEPMGYMLFNERMLETYLHAKKWLKSTGGQGGGKMFPSQGDLHIAPFTDAALYMEQMNKANFWIQDHFHGVNLTSLKSAAVNEYFRQPVVDTFDIRICMAKSFKYSVNFETAAESDLHRMEIPLSFTILQSGEVHGLAFWFDVAFHGSTQSVWLSTSPTQPLTHWYQVRCLVDTPILLYRGQQLTGHVILTSNKRQSYDVEVELVSPTGERVKNTLDLKNPFFRYTGQAPQPPPGVHETSPSEQYWTTMDTTNSATTIVNGVDPSLNQVVMNGHHVAAANPVNLVDITPFNSIIAPPQHHQQQIITSQHAVLGSPGGTGGNNRNSPGLGQRSSTQIVVQGQQIGVPCSIGGGISPSLFSQQPIHQSVSGSLGHSSSSIVVPSPSSYQHHPQASSTIPFNASSFPVSNNLMIGDYAAALGQQQTTVQQAQAIPGTFR